MGKLRPVAPPRGDEAELFREFNDELLLQVAQNVRADSSDTVEDAVAFAWERFMVYQPERDMNWKGWLFRTAQRQAWLLERQRRDHVAIRASHRDWEFSRSPETKVEVREDVEAALEVLKQLPLRQQRVAMLRVLGFKHREISELTGDSMTRVNVLVRRVNDRLSDLHEDRLRQEPPVSGRAGRLRELEQEQPEWLTDRIGALPGHKRGSFAGESVKRRAWRRAALALDDYRAALGSEDLPELPMTPPTDPSLRTIVDRALRAVTELHLGRDSSRTIDP
ncbi:sigma-70 family RNA polymerase sigma factor [Solirubrobacter taibaiensis]|nr:sigma-70 family RNA polymerase sigma factor [Solirubrobacter taibaiensis]